MLKKITHKYSFVILDIILRLFTLIYTLSSNYFLDTFEFNKVSFFRTTIAMIVGLTSTALGYFILNFYNTSKNTPTELSKIINLTLILPIFSIVTSAILIFIFPNLIGIARITEINSSILFLICLFSITSQIFIYIIKVVGGLEKNIISYLLLNIILIIVTVLSLYSKINNAQYYTLLAFYLTSSILYFLIILKSSEKKKIIESFNIKTNPFDSNFRSFYIPNFIESLLSVPRTWLSFTVFIYIIGFNQIGEILLIQMCLGLFIFLCNSFTLNKYIEINSNNLSTRTISLNQNVKPVLFLSLIMVFTTIIFWDLIKSILKISQITDNQILILCIATIIQAIQLPFGTIFKKNNLSKLTLYHNLILLISFILIECILLKTIGETGYYWAYSISWLIVLFVMSFQSIKYNVCSPKKLLVLTSSIISLYLILFLTFIN